MNALFAWVWGFAIGVIACVCFKDEWHWVAHKLGMNQGYIEHLDGKIGFRCAKCGKWRA